MNLKNREIGKKNSKIYLESKGVFGGKDVFRREQLTGDLGVGCNTPKFGICVCANHGLVCKCPSVKENSSNHEA